MLTLQVLSFHQNRAAAAIEEEIECISKHTKGATVLRTSYRFKSAEIKSITRLADYQEGIAGSDFKWEHHLIQGRQLITPDILQAKWPAEWTEFQDTVFPGLVRLARDVHIRYRENTELNDHEGDCRNQALVDQALCCTLLVDSAFHYDQFRASACWKELGIFSDPTSKWMQWHHDEFAPWVQQLQRDAERAHACIRHPNGSMTVLDQARSNLGIINASSSQSWELLREMVKLMDENSGGFGVATIPKQPEPMLPLPKVYIETLSFPNALASPKTLRPLWDLWQNSLSQYFSPLHKNSKPIPAWDTYRPHTENWNNRKDMLLELDRQVAFCHSNITKVKDRAVAVTHVLGRWNAKMEAFEYVREGQKVRPRNILTPVDLGRCFFQATSQQKDKVVLKKAKSKSVTGDEVCSAQEFLSVFRSVRCSITSVKSGAFQCQLRPSVSTLT